MMKLSQLFQWLWKSRPAPKRKGPKLICANCKKPIRKSERWSAKRWPDGQPRHWAPCPVERAVASGVPESQPETTHELADPNPLKQVGEQCVVGITKAVLGYEVKG